MPDGAFDANLIRAAAQLLEQGGLVAFPTETVYGLGADAENPAAVASIYAAKARPANHPIIVHLAPEADLSYWASSIPAQAQALIAAFWPGPLTLILPRAVAIPDAVSGGQDSIGVRCPSHPVAQALLRCFKQGRGGIAAPSANKFGRISPTTAQHVLDEFGAPQEQITHGILNAVLDGGASAVGIESTILDLSRVATKGSVLLRPGHISAQQIAEVLGVMPASADVSAPRASGTLAAHYAPRTPLLLVQPEDWPQLSSHLDGYRCALINFDASLNLNKLIEISVILPADADGYAHGLYAALRQMDDAGVDLILVQAPPASAAWNGVNDRLRRAAHDSLGLGERLRTENQIAI
ncbi:MAG: L-threonylcarbamoyladenylate synthase [Herbaspirillum sp.]